MFLSLNLKQNSTNHLNSSVFTGAPSPHSPKLAWTELRGYYSQAFFFFFFPLVLGIEPRALLLSYISNSCYFSYFETLCH